MTGSNARAAARALARLRKQDRLDELGELLAVLLRTSAVLVDEATGPGSDVAAYARAQVIRAHGALVDQLADLVGPQTGDAVETWIAQMGKPSSYQESEAFTEEANRYWRDHGVGTGDGRFG